MDQLPKEAGIDSSSQLLPGSDKPKRAKLDFYWTRRKMSQIGVLLATLTRVWKSTS